MKKTNTAKRWILIIMAGTSLSACNTIDRLENVGGLPVQNTISDPLIATGHQPVSMPMPEKTILPKQANSLWTGAQQGFFKDQRAKTVGDIMTVVIDINDQGKMENSSERSRSTSETAAMPALWGTETKLAQVLPEAVDPTDLVDATSDSSYKGDGTIDRKETIEMKLAATVTQVLPNGNMVIKGTQEVRINYENRILMLAGVVRPQDVSIDNSISYDQIAEARISYGGKGQISDVQQPRMGTQVYDILFPF